MTVATVTAVVVAATAVPAGLGGFLWPLLTGFTGNRTDPSGGGFELNKRINYSLATFFPGNGKGQGKRAQMTQRTFGYSQRLMNKHFSPAGRILIDNFESQAGRYMDDNQIETSFKDFKELGIFRDLSNGIKFELLTKNL